MGGSRRGGHELGRHGTGVLAGTHRVRLTTPSGLGGSTPRELARIRPDVCRQARFDETLLATIAPRVCRPSAPTVTQTEIKGRNRRVTAPPRRARITRAEAGPFPQRNDLIDYRSHRPISSSAPFCPVRKTRGEHGKFQLQPQARLAKWCCRLRPGDGIPGSCDVVCS